MHLIPRESNRSVVSRQVCVELRLPGAHFISPQLMARSINAFICYHDDDNHHHHHHNYNKILKSDWLSTALILALIGQ